MLVLISLSLSFSLFLSLSLSLLHTTLGCLVGQSLRRLIDWLEVVNCSKHTTYGNCLSYVSLSYRFRLAFPGIATHPQTPLPSGQKRQVALRVPEARLPSARSQACERLHPHRRHQRSTAQLLQRVHR